MYLVREGDSVAGRYTVVQIDPENGSAARRAGTEQRLVLP